jgi:hypothetical protein
MSVAEIVQSVTTLNRDEFNELWLMLEKRRNNDKTLEFAATLGHVAEIYTPLESYEAAQSLQQFLESRK